MLTMKILAPFKVLAGLSALLLLAGPFYSFAQDSIRTRLDTYMRAAEKTGFNGDVLTAKNGKIVYQQAFGYRDFDSRALLDNQSAFTLCSVSKQFTAMAVMLLKEQHKLKLTDTLRKYFPELPYHNITIANMLTHTSGLPDYQLLMVHNWDHSKIAGNADLIKMLAEKRPPVFFKPGEKYRYCNTGYVMLAAIIEQVSGRPFQDFMREYIFKPAHMGSSHIYNPATSSIKPRYARGFMYVDSLKKYVPAVNVYPLVYYLGGIVGDAGMVSTTGDLLKWDRALKNKVLLNKHDQEDMFGPHALIDTLSKIYYGYGVVTGKSDLGPYITHEGIWPGYRTCLTRYTDHDITIIVLSNNESNAVGTSRALSYIMHGKEVVPPYQHKEIAIDPQKLIPLTGTYLSPAPVEIIAVNGKLYRHRAGTPDIELKPESNTKFFYADSSDRQVEFTIDANGNVLKAYLVANGIRSELVKQKPTS